MLFITAILQKKIHTVIFPPMSVFTSVIAAPNLSVMKQQETKKELRQSTSVIKQEECALYPSST
jgi:hypothetical protein